MKIATWLKSAHSRLHTAYVPTARLDAEILLSDELKKDRSWIQTHQTNTLTDTQIKKLDAQLAMRQQHIPIAYIRGKQEFYRREFTVTPDTLTPRPETETMVEMALNILQNSAETWTICDVGTGSGCIIISMSLELPTDPQYRFVGIDISQKALEIARRNATAHHATVTFIENNILSQTLLDFLPAADRTIILANLPYVPDDFHINVAASHEPPSAIFGGLDGLDYYRSLFEQLANRPGTSILTESLPPQHTDLQSIASTHGYTLETTEDFIQLFSC